MTRKVYPIPLEVLKILAEVEVEFRYNYNGPDAYVCTSCWESLEIQYDEKNGNIINRDDFKHDLHCPAVYARKLLNA